MRPFALALLLLSAEAYRSGDAKRAARAGASAPEELKDRQHVVDELSGCIASLNSETKALSHAIGVIATLSGDLGADLAHGPYGAIGEWAAKELPKAIVG